MTIQTAKLSIGAYIYVNNTPCQVNQVAVFSDTLHFGFTQIGGDSITGWVPVDLVGQAEISLYLARLSL